VANLSEDENIRMHGDDCQAGQVLGFNNDTSHRYNSLMRNFNSTKSRSLCRLRESDTQNGRFNKGLFFFVLFLTLASSPVLAQQSATAKREKLPSPDKVVSDYIKAIGGKKRVAAIKDASYEWTILQDNTESVQRGTVTMRLKTPASTHTKVDVSDGLGQLVGEKSAVREVKLKSSIESGANVRSAWRRDPVTGLQTRTDTDAQTAKLYSMLDASHLLDYKKAKILARVVGLATVMGESAFGVEFSLRSGARVRYWFSVSSKLLLMTEDAVKDSPARRTFSDYRYENGLLEPHRLRIPFEGLGVLTLELKQVRYNTGLPDSLFDPPTAESIDVVALLTEIDRNQAQIDERVSDYTYTEKLTERKINDKGEVTEEIVTAFEVYPLPGRNDVRKLISENGVPLTPEKAAKEEKRVVEEMEKAENERSKTELKRERDRQRGKTTNPDDDPGIADFLRAAELVSPRRERLRNRDSIVFDFRPRAGYKPKGRVESIVSKLAGVVWIDPIDKQVMRLEARLIDSYKMGGGLLASVRPGTALVFEQKRMEDGVWLPVFSQVNISAKILLFKSVNVNVTQEFSNYQRFGSSVDDYKLSAPKP
jgi:hypothetical protein